MRPAHSRPAGGRLALALTLGAAACLSSCGKIADYGAIVEGNRYHERGDYEDAAAAYLSVSESAYRATVDYDLANSYARLGEVAAAAPLWTRARDPGERGLSADSHFNEGVALFERQRYEDAWRAFRAALTDFGAAGEPGSAFFAHDARVNLELAWKAWRKQAAAPPRSVAPSSGAGGGMDEEELRLLRRLETGTWSPGRDSGAEGKGDDW